MPAVNKIKSFDQAETEYLIKKIILGKSKNVSVRKTILELAGGDEKLSLRYQNKYRNVLQNDRELISRICAELGIDEEELKNSSTKRISEQTMKRLKTSINTLVQNIAKNVQEEKDRLKERNALLEKENERLRKLLYEKGSFRIETFFKEDCSNSMIN